MELIKLISLLLRDFPPLMESIYMYPCKLILMVKTIHMHVHCKIPHVKSSQSVTTSDPTTHFLAFEQACDIIWSSVMHPTQVPDGRFKDFYECCKGTPLVMFKKLSHPTPPHPSPFPPSLHLP